MEATPSGLVVRLTARFFKLKKTTPSWAECELRLFYALDDRVYSGNGNGTNQVCAHAAPTAARAFTLRTTSSMQQMRRLQKQVERENSAKRRRLATPAAAN